MVKKLRTRKESAFILKVLEDMKSGFMESGNEASPRNLIYPQVRKSVLKAISHLPPHTKIPSIRQISKAVGVTTISVQKAINELVSENTLYSRPKSGIYTAMKSTSKEAQFGVFPYGYFRFATDSKMPFQRPLWDTAAEEFSRDCTHVRLQIDYDFTSNYSNDSVNLPDCLECSEWTLNTRTPEKAFLPLDDFLKSETGGNTVTLLRNRLLPLYYQSYFIFFNRELMDKQKIPLPEFTTFTGQSAYLKAAGVKTKACSGDEVFLTDFNYSTFKDSLFPSFMQLVKIQPRTADTGEILVPTVFQIRNLFQHNTIPREKREPAFRRFTEGKSPMLIAGSIEAWRLLASVKKFSLQTWPLLNLDNSCFKLVISGAVLQKTLCPLESIRFLCFLRGSSMQKRFSDVGFIPVDSGGCGLFEKGAKAETLLKNTLPPDNAGYAFEQAEHYIKYCILNVEINRCIYGLQSPEEAVRKAVMLSRAFLKSKTSAKTE